MAKFGQFDDKEIISAFDNFQKAINSNQILNSMVQEMNDVANLGVAEVKQRTPVDHGRLRQSWTKTQAINTGNSVQVDITNNTEYASFVEFGHRQTPGRYVPAIGKRLKVAWVPGRFMLKNSVSSIEKVMVSRVTKRFESELGKLFGK